MTPIPLIFFVLPFLVVALLGDVAVVLDYRGDLDLSIGSTGIRLKIEGRDQDP